MGLVSEGLVAVKGRGRDTEWETMKEQSKGGCRPWGGSILPPRKQTLVAWKNRSIKPVCNLILRGY